MSFGARLAEERKRLGFKQAEFAAMVGSDMPKQSLYENDHRALRGDYLSRIAAVGVDLLYVLTGQRTEAALFGEDASALLRAYLTLPKAVRAELARLVGELARQMPQGTERRG
jgi:transcriptional regulator with XRE-family HTH domain